MTPESRTNVPRNPKERSMSRHRCLPFVSALVLGLAACLPALAASAPSLEVAGPGGVRAFSVAQLRTLPATEGFGGVKSSTGKVTLPGRWKGVALRELAAAAGGYDSTRNLAVTAKDGYSITFSHHQVMNGDFTAYDPGTGDTLAAHEPLAAIIVYEHEGRALDAAEDGPLRVMIVSATGSQVTDGHWSIKWVTKLAIKPASEAWSLGLEGGRSEIMDRATFESGASPKCHGVTWKDARGRAWTGIPLWLLVGRVDDGFKHGARAFNDSLAAAGYTVDVVAGDGSTVSFDSSRFGRNDGILVASLLDGAPLPAKSFPLQLTGPDLKDEERLGGIARIVMRVPGTLRVR
jgi:DMSO/TMAO reductase YedYZ molybdopterin-dependent catalytic subunit